MRGWLKILCALVLFIVLVAVVATHLAPRPEPEQKYFTGTSLPRGSVQPQLVCSYIGDAILLAPDGSLWIWGGRSSSLHYLTGRTAPSSVPVPLNQGHDWRQVAAAFAGLAAIKADGTLWLWTNAAGARTSPRQFGSDTNWAQLSGFTSHFMALKKDGTLWGWGQNESGQVGVTNSPSNTSASSLPLAAVLRTGMPPTIRINFPVQVGTDHDWTAIAAGAFNSYALKRDGTIWEWGSHVSNSSGATNIPEPAQFDPGTNWTAISAGDFHIVALKSDGTLWLAGQNAASMLPRAKSNPSPPNPSANAPFTPVGSDSDWTDLVSGQNCFYARKRDGSWWFLGQFYGMSPATFSRSNGNPPQKVLYQLDPWAFATGGSTTLLLARDGNLWSWGPRLGSTFPVSVDEKITNFFNNIRAVFRPRGAQNLVRAQRQGYGPNSDAILDAEPHKLWTLPASMRRFLANHTPVHTNPPPRL